MRLISTPPLLPSGGKRHALRIKCIFSHQWAPLLQQRVSHHISAVTEKFSSLLSDISSYPGEVFLLLIRLGGAGRPPLNCPWSVTASHVRRCIKAGRHEPYFISSHCFLNNDMRHTIYLDVICIGRVTKGGEEFPFRGDKVESPWLT